MASMEETAMVACGIGQIKDDRSLEAWNSDNIYGRIHQSGLNANSAPNANLIRQLRTPNRADSFVDAKLGTVSLAMQARYLAAEIQDGRAEDPYEKTIQEYETPPKPPPEADAKRPVRDNSTKALPKEADANGPARFNDTKMFNTADADFKVDVTSTFCPGRQSLPEWLLTANTSRKPWMLCGSSSFAVPRRQTKLPALRIDC